MLKANKPVAFPEQAPFPKKKIQSKLRNFQIQRLSKIYIFKVWKIDES